MAFLDVYGNADIDTCTLLQMPVLFILHYWLMKLQEEKKTFFFNVLLDVQNPQKVY